MWNIASVPWKILKSFFSNKSSWALAAASRQVLRAWNYVCFSLMRNRLLWLSQELTSWSGIRAPVATKQRDISANRLLRTHPTLSKSVKSLSRHRNHNYCARYFFHSGRLSYLDMIFNRNYAVNICMRWYYITSGTFGDDGEDAIKRGGVYSQTRNNPTRRLARESRVRDPLINTAWRKSEDAQLIVSGKTGVYMNCT